MTTPAPKFPLGLVALTPGAAEALEEAHQEPSFYLKRHASGDWGDLDDHDVQVNEDALLTGERLLSVYTLPSDVVLWIITERGRHNTTLLLPEEY